MTNEVGELEQFILSHCTVPGCRVEVSGHEVLVHTPPITTDTELIVLHDGHIIAQGTAGELDDSKDEVVKQFMSSAADTELTVNRG